jgi:hypothetical protein
MKLLIKKRRDFNSETYFAFVDYKKAFDNKKAFDKIKRKKFVTY